MKMIPGSGTTLDYPNFTSNCAKGQRNYKIPITSLADVQLYIDFGASDPGDVASYDLIHTCGALIGTTEPVTPTAYVIGQDPTLNFYGVFQGFSETTTATCFIIAITVGDVIYFSEEYCFEPCKDLTLVKGCYGNLDPLISFDAEGIYFGQSQGGTLGDASVVYEHKFYMRDVEVSLNGIKNDFKQGLTRTFRTESTHLFLFWGEFVPAWYLRHVDGVFRRGEVFVGDDGTKYLLDSTLYENIDDCFKAWRPAALFKESHNNSFSCEVDPCTVVVGDGGGETETCCNPTVTDATVEFIEGELGGSNQVCIEFTECIPTPANGFTVLYRLAGSGGSYTSAGSSATSPFCFDVGGEDGDQYEGFIYSDCGGGITGSQIPWTTGITQTITIVRTTCSVNYSEYTISGATPGDVLTVQANYSGFMLKVGNSFVRADLTLNGPVGQAVPNTQLLSSPCYADTLGHGFGPLIATVVLTLTGTTILIQTIALVNNSLDSFNSLFVTITDINGTPVNIGAIGCDGNSSTGGTC